MLRSRGGMTIAEVIISMMLIFILILVVTTVAGSVKDRCVSGENRHEANKLAMYVLEKLLPLAYTDASLDPTTPPANYAVALPNCNLKDRFMGTGSYTVTKRTWGSEDYKEIIATINWIYNNRPESVSFGLLKRQE